MVHLNYVTSDGRNLVWCVHTQLREENNRKTAGLKNVGMLAHMRAHAILSPFHLPNIMYVLNFYQAPLFFYMYH